MSDHLLSPLMRRSLAAKKAARTRKLMALAAGRDAECSRCHGPRDSSYDFYCYECRAAYMRSYRARKTSRETRLPLAA